MKVGVARLGAYGREPWLVAHRVVFRTEDRVRVPELGTADYPEPIVDHREAVQRFAEMLQRVASHA
ncbi:MAG: hypothetical protein QOC77_2136 [Thermoleophilaceae bacterium]|nr:hypothetical protein [Thermoleophilaceae bacterium]MEA2471552.1 hypothetical protein [Thermoleophilaceae bacterium]